MRNNRQIGLDGRIFITDCLSDGIFFIYSILLSGLLGACGDVMKLLGESSRGMDPLTNGLVLCDLVCSLSMVIVTYYVYFMHCGENIPKLGTKPLIYLEYLRLGYYGVLAYEVLYRFANDLQGGSGVPAAIPVFYFFYFVWLICCMCAAMFILTVLHQNVIRRSYAQSFKWLSLIGLGVNVILPLVYFITRIWVRGWGDGFYSAGLCDFVRFALAPIFYAAIWFLFMSAIDQVERVFSEVDNAIRDKRYRIEFEENDEENASDKKKKMAAKKKAVGGKKKSAKKKEVSAALPAAREAVAQPTPVEPQPAPAPILPAAEEDVKPQEPTEPEQPEPVKEAVTVESVPDEEILPVVMAVEASQPEPTAAAVAPEEIESDTEDEALKAAKRVKPKKKHRITSVEEDTAKVKTSQLDADELTADILKAADVLEGNASGEQSAQEE